MFLTHWSLIINIFVMTRCELTSITLISGKFETYADEEGAWEVTDWDSDDNQQILNGTDEFLAPLMDFQQLRVSVNQSRLLIILPEISDTLNCRSQAQNGEFKCFKSYFASDKHKVYLSFTFNEIKERARLISEIYEAVLKPLYLRSLEIDIIQENCNDVVCGVQTEQLKFLRSLKMNISYETSSGDGADLLLVNLTALTDIDSFNVEGNVKDSTPKFFLNKTLPATLISLDAYLQGNKKFILEMFSAELSEANSKFSALIDKYVNGAQDHVSRVRRLQLTGNSFSCSFSHLEGFISSATNLTELRLADCGFDRGEFSRPSANDDSIQWLESLDLSGNSFSDFSTELRLISLRTLNLSGQRPGGPECRTGVGEEVDLRCIFSFRAGEDLGELRVLDLSNMPLDELQSGTFNNTPNLMELYLKSCNIKYLPPQIFHGLQVLTILDLSHNAISVLQSDNFRYLKENSIINFCCNDAPTIEPQNLKSVLSLDFSYNFLNTSSNLFQDVGLIHELNLSGNNLTSIDLGDELYVERLNLSDNMFLGMPGRLPRGIQVVDLGSNKLDCSSCDLREIQGWLRDNVATILNLNSSTPLTCSDLANHNKPVWEASLNPTCGPNLVLFVGLPALVICVVALVSFLLFVYRYEIHYMRNLWKIKRKHEKRQQGQRCDDECRFDAFVSFCSADRQWVVETLVPALENPQDKYSLCLHERDFELGSYIVDNIAESIEHSRRVILILSPDFIKSEWCRWELRLVQQRAFDDQDGDGGDFLLLVKLSRLDKRSLPSNLRLLMTTRTYLEWPEIGVNRLTWGKNDGEFRQVEFWRRLKKALGPPMARPAREELPEVENHDIWGQLLGAELAGTLTREREDRGHENASYSDGEEEEEGELESGSL